MSALFQNIGFDPRHEGFSKGKKEYRIEKIAKIDFLESSGLELEGATDFWTHNDSGGDPKLVKFNMSGEMTDSLVFALYNRDWEDIARDNEGTWYIGEFGNNSNKRKNLKIYIVREQQVDSILFNYPDQEKFPPPDDQKNFDCEAMFWSDGSLYLFSKNRGEKIVKAYRLTDKAGKQTAELIDKVRMNRMITGADINDENTQFSLLSYGMIYTFEWLNPQKPFSKPLLATKFTRSGQAEGIAYLGENELLVSNESGKIFRIRRK